MTEGGISEEVISRVLASVGATGFAGMEVVQELWSGYGSLLRLRLRGRCVATVVVKLIDLGEAGKHPRGWNSDFSHDRKLRSYEVEAEWYRSWSGKGGGRCRMPELLGEFEEGGLLVLILEDLAGVGFPELRSEVREEELWGCVAWLAGFHARFLGARPEGLWERGTYWQLATRPEELKRMPGGELREAAGGIDERLREARYQTIVHGDAKLANFCFGEDGGAVAAVDFQYVGGGCGMQDLAYFVGSCLDAEGCEKREEEVLERYFTELRKGMAERGTKGCAGGDPAALEEEWRGLYCYAWADFERFLQGWSPGHWKLSDYSARMTRLALDGLS